MFDVSLRHLSVPHVLFFLLLAPLPRMIAQLWSQKRWIAITATVIVTVSAASSLYTAVHAYPYYMTCFNTFASGRPTYFLASDSNVDWNQALLDVKAFLESRDSTESASTPTPSAIQRLSFLTRRYRIVRNLPRSTPASGSWCRQT
jgi:hypothetical protein